MRFQAAQLSEHAAADFAGVRFLPAVRLQVNLQVTGRLEALPAEAAAVRPNHRVVLLVRAQVGDGAELQAAERTAAGDRRRVSLEVFAQRGHAGHRGATRHARQHPYLSACMPAFVHRLLVHL